MTHIDAEELTIFVGIDGSPPVGITNTSDNLCFYGQSDLFLNSMRGFAAARAPTSFTTGKGWHIASGENHPIGIHSRPDVRQRL
jgi:hypothetical protein